MTSNTPLQLKLDLQFNEKELVDKKSTFNDPAFASNKILPIHRWVPWIAGFSKDFVTGVLNTHIGASQKTILDPFAGVGTTLVECMLRGHNVIGFEINPYAHLASHTKIKIDAISVSLLQEKISDFWHFYSLAIQENRQANTSAPAGFHTRIPFYSVKVLEKVLLVMDFITSLDEPTIRDVFRIAFASTMVSYSNYSYEPSLATRASSGKADIENFPVGETILDKLQAILTDVKWFYESFPQGILGERKIINENFFNCDEYILDNSVDFVITSPPYLNNYHYNRNTRPHLYWLDYVQKPSDFKVLEQGNFGTYWQTAREHSEIKLEVDLLAPELKTYIEVLRNTNPEKGIYGGKGWANYAATYFNDCFRFCKQILRVLKPGGKAIVVIGNSILQGMMIPTDRHFAQIAQHVGLKLVGIDIPRELRVGNSIIQSEVRSVKANTKHQLYEAVVTLQKP